MQPDGITLPATLQCRACRAEKPLSEFRRNRAKATGYENLCLLCNRARVAEARRKKPYTGPKGNTLRTCETCGREFLVWAATVRYGYGRFCQLSCKRLPKPIIAHPYEITEAGDARIPLRRRDGTIRAYTIVDATDADWLCRWRWSLDSHGYAYRLQRVERIQKVRVSLHRLILGLESGDKIDVDHINRDKLDNRRVNLRALPKGLNSQNLPSMGTTSSFRGVSWNARKRKWTASVTAAGHQVLRKTFDTELEAAEAARAARLLHMPGAID